MAAAAPLIADPIVRNRGTLVGSLCHADPQGDWASVVTALGGHVVAQGATGRRTIPMADFVTGPFQNVLDVDEIAVEAVIPAPRATPAGGYLKLERRVGDFATAGVGRRRRDSSRVESPAPASRSPGSAARRSTPRDAAEALVGRPLDADTHRRGPPTWPPRRPSRRPTTGAARSTSATSCTPSSSGS